MGKFFDMATQTPQVGQSLKALRQLAGLTLEQVSNRADTAPAYLSKVENGKLVPNNVYVARVSMAIAEHLAEGA